MYHDHRVALIIPAYNEETAIGQVLASLPDWFDDVIVVDNNSTDRTAAVASEHGATVIHESRQGYGAACMAGLAALATHEPIDLVVFMDADRSDDPNDLAALLQPLIKDQADLVIGSRATGNAEPGSLTLPQRFGNKLATYLLRKCWSGTATDLGPMRAVRLSVLEQLRMNDLNYGWTVQMQARAAASKFRTVEVPVAYRRRVGQSKISGTIRGVFGAGTKILSTIACEFMHARLQPATRQRIIVFTRLPEPGTTKTRMIRALGPQGAADLQKEMTQLTLATAANTMAGAGDVHVRYQGGTARQMTDVFGAAHRYLTQGEGDLGDRMHRAFEHAHQQGCSKIICVGSDCPSLTPTILHEAFDALQDNDLVVGPALDGGYYLIGMNRPRPELFGDVTWGTDTVLAQTLKIAKVLKLRVAQLQTLSDVDVPEDLAHWQQVRSKLEQNHQPRLSVIIPALNEEASIKRSIDSAKQCPDVQIIVADGGSEDRTCEIAIACGATVVQSEPGRGRQLRCGTAVATGQQLLFLHADTRLPFCYWREVSRILDHTKAAAGAFDLAFDEVTLSLRLIEWGTHVRSSWRGLPYGDQALFMTREVYDKVGGFEPFDVMEDLDLVRKLRRIGPVRVSPLPVITSARKYVNNGSWWTVMKHQRMLWFSGPR